MKRIFWLMILCAIVLPARADTQLAGEVTSGMGVVLLIAKDTLPAVEGMQLHVGDVLQTGAGGHLHLRMVDDALVSLRPNSKLRISSYTYHPGEARATKIRMDLLYGTVRSVTGKGGQLAKDLFRMNTPVAAIGVRGTDFIAQTDANNTLVHVASGAIVLAPLGGDCHASSLGACQIKSARVLTAETQNMMLEFSRGMTEPRLVPLIDQLKMSAPQALDSQTKLQPAAQAVPGAAGQDAAEVASQKKTLDNLTAIQTAAAIPVHYEMVWGRWSWATQANDLGIPIGQAAQGREATIGTGTSGLYRDTGPMMLPQSGQTQFNLRASQVSLQNSTGQVQGQVLNGTLGVDFNASTFNTTLNMTAPGVTAALSAAGSVRNDGIMVSAASASNGSVLGSLSRSGAEAGYQFALPTAAGQLSGSTLWIK